MDNKRTDADRVVLRQKRGTWRRFGKVLARCRLPWVWLAGYIVLQVGNINIGLDETEYTAALLAGDTSPAALAKLVLFIVLSLVSGNLLLFVGHVTSARINRNMRGIVQDKVLRLPMSFFRDENPRDAVYRITQNAVVVDSTVMVFLIPVAAVLYKSVSIFARVFRYDWRLSAILIAFIPVDLFLAFLFGRINYSLTERGSFLNASLTQRLGELVTNIPLTKAFAREAKETERSQELTGRLYRLNIKTNWLSQLQELTETVPNLIQSIIIVLLGMVLLGSGAISRRSWVSFYMFSSLFTGAISELRMYWNNIKIIQGGAERVAEIMDAPEEDLTGESCRDLRGDLVLDHVRFGYDEAKPVLRDASCTFSDNAVTALLGVSGCGKTTLVNLLTRLYDPQGGAITVAGKDIRDYALEDYRDQFVMVSQNSMIFSGTIRENVCYGNGEVSEERLMDALRKAGASGFVQALPQGLDTPVAEYGANLSGGQRQRLAMARALLSGAHYVILDEPVAAMDALAVSELVGILRDIARDRCVIVIAHSKAVLSIAGRVVVVEDGAVAAQGEAEEVRKTNNFLRAFFGNEVTA